LTALQTAISAGTQSGISLTVSNGALNATVTGGGLLPDKTGNYGKWLTLDNAGNLAWHTAPLGSGLSLPSQPGNQGSYLTTDGVNLVWADIAINTLHSGTQTLTLDEATGDVYLNRAVPTGTGSVRLPLGGDILKYNGSSYVSALNGLINSLYQDSNPTLSHNLDLNGHNITGATGTINIAQGITAGAIVGSSLSAGSGSIAGGATTVTTINATTGLGGNLNLNSHALTGSGSISIVGSVTATNVAVGNLTVNSNSIDVTSGSLYVSNSNQQMLQYKGINVDGNINNTPQVNLYSSRGTILSPGNNFPGDWVSVINFGGYQAGNYQQTAGIISQYDPTANMASDYPNSNLLFATNNGTNQNVAFFDYQGTFSAPTLKTGSYNGSVVYPTNPVAGMIIFDSSNKHFYGYNGTMWKQLDN
jgi:hypothetical protein